MNKFKFELGVTLKSVIHGYEGVAVARSEHITGCNQYMVQPGLDKDGKLKDCYWLDEHALVQTKAKQIVLPQPEEKPGGPPVTARRVSAAGRR